MPTARADAKSSCYVLYGRGTNLVAIANDTASSFTNGHGRYGAEQPVQHRSVEVVRKINDHNRRVDLRAEAV